MLKIPCEVFTRVVGYYRPTSQMNKGKKEEFKDRKFFVGFNEHSFDKNKGIDLKN